ncbi:uncharacterized protein PHACADRAFT_192194 [Phanerochaete carnosa HHB-10118-sp]|uniref:Cytochrome P450 n=1 Tax=Phanerochaete carnosa (strain HHB-10118-sp) TaxID=650164 RepID=K5WL03_PHACS|nr:uncharacterized protein PHACADRAFT_192194 [Phanerochaete carnosa HHB-10118-sp]EKM59819.1 hypothetical protein PHACADRAFT_192194 [Phanerochaete carnosa HHB-10118-sp]
MDFLLIVYTIGALVALALYKLASFMWSRIASPLRHLPGPPNDSLLRGNVEVLQKEEESVPQDRWAQQYGHTIAYRGLFSTRRLWTVDTRALNHIMTHHTIYQRPLPTRYRLSGVVGPGVLVTEGKQHKQQRRIRNLTEIFTGKSNQLRDCWLEKISKNGGASAQVDALSWLGQATLDIIGRAGFGYEFDALNPTGEINELSEAFLKLFATPPRSRRLFSFLQLNIPLLRLIKTEENHKAEQAQATMRRIGMQLIREKKAAIMAETLEKGREVECKDMKERDLLTLLIRTNMSTDIPEDQRLTDDEVLAQVPTFIVAGHETTSMAVTWALFSLSQQPDMQRKLREELLQVATDSLTMDKLNALPYLDAVVRETLRHHSPVPATTREAFEDDIIPVDTPYTDRYGRTREYIEVKKGDLVFLPILALNRRKEIWGEDAHEFKPERWEHIPKAVASVPGVWGNQLTFIGGPRACIGYRFSLVETKALLFALVRAF